MWDFIKNDTYNAQHKRDALLFADSILGLGFTEAGAAKKVAVLPHAELPPAVKDLMEQRKAARDAKDFEKSDDIRKRLEALGYIVKDTGAEPEVTLK